MSKAKYVEPTMEIIQLETVDIITTSTDAFEGEWVPIGGQSGNDGFFPNE